jgi:hypothetical protein
MMQLDATHGIRFSNFFCLSMNICAGQQALRVLLLLLLLALLPILAECTPWVASLRIVDAANTICVEAAENLHPAVTICDVSNAAAPWSAITLLG